MTGLAEKSLGVHQQETNKDSDKGGQDDSWVFA
jgi:hypothetical protein